ncbi:MAG: protein of unknown function cysteine-rich region domain protein [Herminiimonas sp.]|nr:protein of unknown function cysteine-rich region domain protein [Herminiimonas sp.]
MQPLPETVRGSRSPRILIGTAAVLAALVLALWYAIHAEMISIPVLAAFMDKHRALAPLLFVLLHTIAAIAFVPCSPFTALAGVLWDQPYALLYSVTGAICAASATFGVARTSAGKFLREKFHHKSVDWVFAKVEAHGWETVAFTQINPVFPASTLGYVFGLSRIPFRIYLVTSIVFMLPLQLIVVSFGQTLRNTALSRDADFLIAQFAVMLISGLALIALKPVTRKLLNRDGQQS